MSYIALIPARCGSKSIRLKNIKSFCGKPLIYWTVAALQKTEEIDTIYVATDCDQIESTVNDFGFDKLRVYRRDEKNAKDTSSTESVLLEFIDENKPNPDDFLFLVQATSPFTQAKDFSNAIAKIKEGDSLLSCVNQKRFYWNENGSPINYDHFNRPRRQDFKGEFMENGAFYLSQIKSIVNSKNRISGKIVIYEMPEFTGLELDEPHDWLIGEILMRNYILNKQKDIPKIKMVLSDVDGVLTDCGMYYSEHGDELKKFNTHDGKGFELLRNTGVITGIITSENTKLVKRRAEKLKLDYLKQGMAHQGKLETAMAIAKQENIGLDEVAYIGDDVNCFELLSSVGLAACPSNAINKIKSIPNIINLEVKGGDGALRAFAEIILKHNANF